MYYVSRQNYWGVEPEDASVVEIAFGGREYANPDMLVPRWAILGEGQEFEDPREAARSAIAIWQKWVKEEPLAKIGHGATLGYTVPFEPSDIEEITKWSEFEYSSLDKCVRCHSILPDNPYAYHYDGGVTSEYEYCSENCASMAYEEEVKYQASFGIDSSSEPESVY